jgi:hypothetical protein
MTTDGAIDTQEMFHLLHLLGDLGIPVDRNEVTMADTTDLTSNFWHTRDGLSIRIRDMDTHHLVNSALFLWREADLKVTLARRREFVGILVELDKRRAAIPLHRLQQLQAMVRQMQRSIRRYHGSNVGVRGILERGFADNFNARPSQRQDEPVQQRTDLPAQRSTSRVREFRSINLD